jgi:signal transduction histidine kinase
MGVVIVLATWLTYALMFSSMEARGVAEIRQYTTERAKREEARFVSAEDNHRILRQALVERLSLPVDAATDALAQRRFDELLERTPDGAVRSRRELGYGAQHTTTWIHRDTELTPELRRRIVLLHDLCEQFFPAWRTRVQSLYVSGPERFNTGFDPLFPEWVWNIEPDWDQSREEWAKIATVAANPERTSVWTGVTLDPTTSVPIVTLSTPVDHEGSHVATLHHDISLEALVDENLRPDAPGMKHIIFRRDGMLIAHPDKLADVVASEGRLMIQDSGDPALLSLYEHALASADADGYDPETGNYFAVSTLSGPEWLFVTVMPVAHVQSEAFESAQWVLWTGLASLVIVILLHTAIVRRQIARPLAQLIDAVDKLRRGEPARAGLDRDDELGRLGRAFDQMAADVASRDAELREINQELEQRVEERTTELTRANEQLDRAREDALALLAREREVGKLKSSFVSLVSHEVRTPLGVIQSAADVLDRYSERLPAEERRRHLEMIFRATKNLGELVEGVLMLGKADDGRLKFEPIPLDLRELCEELVDEAESASGRRCPIELECAALEAAKGDPDLLRHIIGNLLSNAVKYSPDASTVAFSVTRRNGEVAFVVRDRGIGIPPDDLRNLFRSFARGSNVESRPGTGLGLVIVERCVVVHGGTITVDSELGVGTTATVVLPMFDPDTMSRSPSAP